MGNLEQALLELQNKLEKGEISFTEPVIPTWEQFIANAKSEASFPKRQPPKINEIGCLDLDYSPTLECKLKLNNNVGYAHTMRFIAAKSKGNLPDADCLYMNIKCMEETLIVHDYI